MAISLARIARSSSWLALQTAASVGIAVLLAARSARATVIDSTSTELATDFENGQLAPMQAATVEPPNYTRIDQPSYGGATGKYAMKFFWEQAAYNGTRLYRGAEAVGPATPVYNFTKDLWEGFSIYLPSGQYPKDKTATIAQLFGGGGTSHISTWAGMVQIRNQDLWISHRGNTASPPDHESLVASGVKWDQWNRITLHAVTSRVGKGEVEVWLNGTNVNAPNYAARNINFAFGDWDTTTDSLLHNGSEVGVKFGMYNWDVGNYTVGETRSFDIDSIHALFDSGVSESQGFAAVDPVIIAPEPAGTTILVLTGAIGLPRRRRLSANC